MVVSALPKIHLTSISSMDALSKVRSCFRLKKIHKKPVKQQRRCWLRDSPVAESSITLMRPQPLSCDSTATR